MSDFEQPVQPMSRAEAILRKYGDVTPMSRVEALLKELVDESGGSDVTVTPVLSEGVRLATIGVDGTDYNIYAPEDVVGSIVSVTTEYNTGTLLATITVNDVEHYIYVPEFEGGALYGFIDPTTLLGSDKDIYFKYNGDNVISEWMNGGSFNPPTQHATYDIENSFGRDISNDYEIKIINVIIGSWTILVSDITTSWTIKDGSWDTGFSGIRINPSTNRYELHTNYKSTHTLQYKTNEFTPISIDSVWHKTGTVWHKNKSYQEITKAEYDALPSSKLSDDILYCITDASSGTAGLNVSIEKILNQHVSTTGVFELDDSIDNYDALLVCGYNYVVDTSSETNMNQYKTNLILKEDFYKNTSNNADHILGNNTSGTANNNPRRVIYYFPDNTHISIQTINFASIDKIFGIKFNQSGGGSFEVNYSTEEQVIGTWIDGKPIYQKTFVISPLTVNTTKTALPSSILTELANAENFISGFCVRLKSEGVTTNTTPLAVWLDGSTLYVYSIVQSNNMTHFTFQYTKTTD